MEKYHSNISPPKGDFQLKDTKGTKNNLTVIHASTEEAEFLINYFLRTQTDNSIEIAKSLEELVALAKKCRPKIIFIFMPGQNGLAVTAQEYIREFLPHSRIRILPVANGTEQLMIGWQRVVTRAIRSNNGCKRKSNRGEL